MAEQLKRRKKRRKRKKKSPLPTILLLLALFLGIGIMAYPSVADWWNSLHQSRAIASYVEIVDNADDELTQELIAAAQEYNASLLEKDNRFLMTQEDLDWYNSVLDLTGTGILGYLQVPAINVNLPIYHGTDETILQVAIGHLDWTSLPVGGESTHAVVSGHRGLPSARLFTDLDKLMVGDVFMVTVLKETLTYQIDQIRIVKPDEVSDLMIVEGEDYMTLVTCTPYGINTHRMLVRGHRIANAEEAREIVITPGATKIPNYISIPAVGIPMLFIFLIFLLIHDKVTHNSEFEQDPERMYRKYKEPDEDELEDEEEEPVIQSETNEAEGS